MKINKETINYLLILSIVFAMTACGGSGNGGSSSCMPTYTDSDGDGFRNGIDPAPNDASIPGDFSTPEKILAHPKVKEVLKIAREHGINISPQLGDNPPNFTMYYRKEYGAARKVNSQSDISVMFAGAEGKICTTNKRYERNGVNFVPDRISSPFEFKGAMLRGSKKKFTHYFPGVDRCGGQTRAYGILITSGNINEQGDMVNIREAYATLYRVGSPNVKCPELQIYEFEDYKKITNLDELEYMCVDGKKAYIPGETWKNSDKESCTCTKNAETECK